jgi:ABC-type multidrug transport system fused ATPase/permease subunit
MKLISSFLLYTLTFNKTINAISKLIMKISNNSASIERILDTVNNKSDQQKKNNNLQLLQPHSDEEDMLIKQPIVQKAIEFREVSFQYSEKRGYIIRNINLKIEPGEYMGIMGASGSGKSTILKLLIGLYMPTEGEISCSFDNKRVAYVPQ